MDWNLVLVFFCIFFIIGGGGTLFWKLRKDKEIAQNTQNTQIAQRSNTYHEKRIPRYVDNNDDPTTPHFTRDAQFSPWTQGACQTLSGTCGKGEMILTRSCVRDGSGDGKKCDDFQREKKLPCYVQCPRPKNVVDWGHANDTPGIPLGAPKKGWYDVSGQGQPNDYCRYVGANGEMFWACHVENEPYVQMDPSHLSFSGGPTNKEIPFVPSLVRQMCPDDNAYGAALDPDLQKSIANGFFSHCGARCVYDHRNPKTGWTFDGIRWNRIENMAIHACGMTFKDEMNKAIDRYEKIYDVKNAWRR